jgi:CRISPR/Cas system-associated exonuclease Cas4 (RecB family)
VPWVDNVATQRGKLIHCIFELERDLEKIKISDDFKEIKKNKILTNDDIKGCFKVYDTFSKSKAGRSILSKERLFAELPIGLNENLEYTKYDKYLKEEYQPDDLFLRGFIDDARVVPDNDKSMVLIDWKSGKLKTKENQDWTQLLYYSIPMFGLNPNLEKVILCYAYVEHNKINTKVITRDNLSKYKQALKNTVNKIEKDSLFEKNETALCDWCDFQDHCQKDFINITEEEMPF